MKIIITVKTRKGLKSTKREMDKIVDELQNSVIGLRNLFPGKINKHEILIAYEEYKYTHFLKDLS